MEMRMTSTVKHRKSLDGVSVDGERALVRDRVRGSDGEGSV